METRHEACSAEGQPRNILKCNPTRFASRCPALSRHCHRVIHSCYAFWRDFELNLGDRRHRMRRAPRRIARPKAGPAGLTRRQDGLRLRPAPQQKQASLLRLHGFKTTLWIAEAGRESVKRRGRMLSARPRGWSGWVVDQRENAACAFGDNDAERSNDVDDIHRQFSRAGPGLGLRDAQLSEIRGRPVLDRFGFLRRRRCCDSDGPLRFGFAVCAGQRRHRPRLRRLPRRDGDQAILRPAGNLARHRADHRADRSRPDVVFRRL